MSILDIYGILTRVESGRMVGMATAKTPIEIDQEALAVAAEVLGTTTKKDTVERCPSRGGAAACAAARPGQAGGDG